MPAGRVPSSIVATALSPPELAEQPRRAFDVGEQEGDGSRRELGHAPSVAQTGNHCKRHNRSAAWRVVPSMSVVFSAIQGFGLVMLAGCWVGSVAWTARDA